MPDPGSVVQVVLFFTYFIWFRLLGLFPLKFGHLGVVDPF